MSDVRGQLLTTREVAELLRVHPKQVYRLMKRGLPAARVGDEWRFQREIVLGWAKASNVSEPDAPAVPSLIAANGDLVIDALLSALRERSVPLLGFVLSDHRGGAELLATGQVLFAGAHEDVSRAARRECTLARLHLVQREIGIATRHGRRFGKIAGIAGKRLATRPATAGIRQALDRELLDAGVDLDFAYRKAREHASHRAVVLAVARGEAEFGLTTSAWASIAGLSFHALKTESYGLIVPAELLGDPRVVRVCEEAQSAQLRKALRALGYGAKRTGALHIG